MKATSAQFDFANPERRRTWARLRDETGREVVVTDYPTSLIQMLLAGVLTGTALREAEALRDAMDRDDLEHLQKLTHYNQMAAR